MRLSHVSLLLTPLLGCFTACDGSSAETADDTPTESSDPDDTASDGTQSTASAAAGDPAPDADGERGTSGTSPTPSASGPSEGGGGGVSTAGSPGLIARADAGSGGHSNTSDAGAPTETAPGCVEPMRLGSGQAEAVPLATDAGIIDGGALADVDFAHFGLALDADAPVIDIAAGGEHVCVLLRDGRVRCWGSNVYGQLGYGHTDAIGDDELPASAGDVSLGGSAAQLAANGNKTCVVLTDGGVKCWGQASWGQLGTDDEDEHIGDDETPADVDAIDLGGAVRQIVTGVIHTCAVMMDGSLICWGSEREGILGFADEPEFSGQRFLRNAEPVDVGGPVVRASAGLHNTCALLEGGSLRCWGLGSRGLLGYGNEESIGDDEVPSAAGDVPVGAEVLDVRVGTRNTCVLLPCGEVRCWGLGVFGNLGQAATDDIGDDELPSDVEPLRLGGPAAAIATCSEVSDQHNCALLWNGDVRCWGNAGTGVLGYAGTDLVGNDEFPDAAGPVRVGGPVSRIETGESFTCALLQNGDVRCWGSGGAELGQGTETRIGDDEHPESIPPVVIE